MRISIFLSSLIVATSAWSSEIDPLTESLIKLRAEVDQLQTELDIQRQEHKAKMASLVTQSGDLENQNKRQEIALNQLKERLSEMYAKASEAGASSSELMPFLEQAIEKSQSVVNQGIPFKKKERLAVLEELSTELRSGKLDAYRGTNRLWAFMEDEMRMTRENGIYSQTILLDGQQVLADVAKIGNMLLYFKTKDEQYGLIKKRGSDWQYVVADSPNNQKAIASLFDSLQKQIRQGYFTLPNPLES